MVYVADNRRIASVPYYRIFQQIAAEERPRNSVVVVLFF